MHRTIINITHLSIQGFSFPDNNGGIIDTSLVHNMYCGDYIIMEVVDALMLQSVFLFCYLSMNLHNYEQLQAENYYLI